MQRCEEVSLERHVKLLEDKVERLENLLIDFVIIEPRISEREFLKTLLKRYKVMV